MKIALIGYGKMGHEIEKIAIERGNEVVITIDALINPQDFTAENLQKADVAIEFTRPDAAFDNYIKCFEAGVPVVSGTTGWLDKMPQIEKMCKEQGKTFFYASNFSIGVNIFFRLNKYLANIMKGFKDYDVKMQEIHHTQKLDKPSGTAKTLADDLVSILDNKSSWIIDGQPKPSEINIDCLRIENVPGTHTVKYFSDIDDIEMTHTAHSRKGFALGAVLAAEFLCGKPAGLYGMDDMLKF
ncbi:MAG: 4-hydroxy-tetrahydrodipicolinate reductase [Bacteroidales bacterium]|nr:4-hydroxy-tetrahydrodipicolinate reductase [Bacteroidales bacterium]